MNTNKHIQEQAQAALSDDVALPVQMAAFVSTERMRDYARQAIAYDRATLQTAPVAAPEFSTDPDGDLCLDWCVGGNAISVSFSAKGLVTWAVDGASGFQQVAPVASTPAVAVPEVDTVALQDALIEMLKGHRLTHMFDAEDDGELGGGHSLTDRLTLEGSPEDALTDELYSLSSEAIRVMKEVAMPIFAKRIHDRACICSKCLEEFSAPQPSAAPVAADVARGDWQALRAIGDKWMSQDGRNELEDWIAAQPPADAAPVDAKQVAIIDERPAGPDLYVFGVKTCSWFGTMYTPQAEKVAEEINAAAAQRATSQPDSAKYKEALAALNELAEEANGNGCSWELYVVPLIDKVKAAFATEASQPDSERDAALREADRVLSDFYANAKVRGCESSYKHFHDAALKCQAALAAQIKESSNG